MEWLSKLASYPWWYYVLAIILGGIGFVGFVFYRGYSRVRPKPLKGVPSPPLTHSLLGHPEGMVHPLKHDIRLQFSENFPYALYQLSLMNHNAIFVNDPVVAAEILDTVPTKGPIYGAYRYDQSLPDILASDGEAFQLRQKYLLAAFQSIQLPDLQSDALTQSLLQYFATSLTQGEANVDLKRLYTLFSLDLICNYYFHYQLDAVNGSTQGDRLYSALTILYDAAATNGIYSFPNARKITPEEITESKDIWRNFLHTIYQHIQQQAKAYESEHADSELLYQSRVDHALVYLQKQQPEIIHEEEIINEIHQIVRHGHESIVASLLWMTYALYRNKRVRENVEEAILQHQQTNEPLTNENYPEYLESFIKELLRRHPALGNMTVRTVNQDVLVFAGIQIPRGSPLHMHMYSLQNTARNWVKPKEFLPERWFEVPTTPSEEIKGNYPKCPFLAASQSEGRVNVYEGVGFQENAISYFPFSAGERICVGRQFALQVLRKVLYDVSRQYRLEAVDGVNENDVGISLHTVIVPSNEKSTTVRVVKIENLKDLVENGDKILSDKVKIDSAKEKVDEGWAEDNDFDFVERKQD